MGKTDCNKEGKRNAEIFAKCKGNDGKIYYIFILNAKTVVVGNNNVVNLEQNDCTVKDAVEIMFSKDSFFNSVLRDDGKMFPNALRRTGSCCGKRYDKITNQMMYYQDNGLAENLELFSQKLLHGFRGKGEIDLQVVIMIQRSIMYIYQSNIATAKEEIERAMTLAEKAENRELLIGRCWTYMAHACLYEKNYETALVYLQRACACLELYVSGDEKASIWYLYGYIFMRMAMESPEPSQKLELKAIECFETELKHAMHDPNEAVVAKKKQYSTLKRISILLRTYSDRAFQHDPLEENLNKAKSLLEYFEIHLWSSAPVSARLHFAFHRADFFFRKGQLERALDILETDGRPKVKQIAHKPLEQMFETRFELFLNMMSPMKTAKPYLDDISVEAIESLIGGDD